MTILAFISGVLLGAVVVSIWFYSRYRWLRFMLVDIGMKLLRPLKEEKILARDAATMKAYLDLDNNPAFNLVKRDIYLTYLLDPVDPDRSIPTGREATYRSGERAVASHIFILAQLAKNQPQPVRKDDEDAETE